MRTNPLLDTYEWLFDLRWQALLLWVLLIASAFIAARNWRQDPEQRSVAHVTIWGVRLLIGGMWYQASTWKLPLPFSDAFKHWLEQSGEHASFQFLGDLVTEVMIPALPVVGTFIYFFELLMAVSLLLGLFVRPLALAAVGQSVFLWLTLYRAEAEWPWNYVFLTVVHILFIVIAAGRYLGADALLRRGRDGEYEGGALRLVT
ncbi:MAG: hypothetical protein ABIP08_02540 [Lautropia sp.]